MRKEPEKLLLILLVSLILCFYSISASESSQTERSEKGRSLETPIVLIPIPLDQEIPDCTLADKNDALWFLFYASKGYKYKFEFIEASSTNEKVSPKLEVSITGGLKEEKFQSDPKNTESSNSNKLTINYEGNKSGNHYIRLALFSKGQWEGKLTYIMQ